MKLKLDELIIGKFYYCNNNDDHKYYIKYNGYDNRFIYCDKYLLQVNGNIIHYFDYGETFCDIDYYSQCKIFKEVSIDKIIDYLPGSNIDKIIHLRQGKIKSLLK